jgi:hydrogenase maturation factor
VRFVDSPLDALRVAEQNPDRRVVFFAVGFETTAPSTAITLLQARARGVENFSVLCNHVTIVPPIKAIKPWECKVFGTACTPETPIGTCMVSSEGACAAYYDFGRLHREAAVTLGVTRV